jgi:hypothetical protein
MLYDQFCYVPLLLTALTWFAFFNIWCIDISAPPCPPVECPEGFKVSLIETEQLKTPEESSTPFKGIVKGVSLSDSIY